MQWIKWPGIKQLVLCSEPTLFCSVFCDAEPGDAAYFTCPFPASSMFGYAHLEGHQKTGQWLWQWWRLLLSVCSLFLLAYLSGCARLQFFCAALPGPFTYWTLRDTHTILSSTPTRGSQLQGGPPEPPGHPGHTSFPPSPPLGPTPQRSEFLPHRVSLPSFSVQITLTLSLCSPSLEVTVSSWSHHPWLILTTTLWFLSPRNLGNESPVLDSLLTYHCHFCFLVCTLNTTARNICTYEWIDLNHSFSHFAPHFSQPFMTKGKFEPLSSLLPVFFMKEIVQVSNVYRASIRQTFHTEPRSESLTSK